MPTEMNQYSVDINNNINDDNNTNKNHSILSPSKKSLSSMMNSKYRYSNSSLLFTSHYFLLWFAVFVFFDLRFWTINQNSASVEATIVCPKLNPVRKTPRFGKRSADYNKMYPFECNYLVIEQYLYSPILLDNHRYSYMVIYEEFRFHLFQDIRILG